MHRAIRAAIFLALISVDAGLTDKRSEVLKCSFHIKDIAMKNCKGPKIKRSATLTDLGTLGRDLTKVASVDAPQNPDHESASKHEKRQFFPDFMPQGPMGFGGYGYPYMNKEQETFHETDIDLPGFEFQDRDSSVIREDMMPPYPSYPMGYRSSGSAVTLGETDDLLGFNMSPDDREELYKDLSKRMPRKSKDFNKTMFMDIVIKCCQNLKACRADPKQIPCMDSDTKFWH